MSRETNASQVNRYGFGQPPSRFMSIGLGMMLVTMIVISRYSSTSLPVLGGLAFGVTWTVAGATWSLPHRPLVWMLVTLVGVAHLIALLFIPAPQKLAYGLLMFPLVVADSWVFYAAIRWIVRKTWG